MLTPRAQGPLCAGGFQVLGLGDRWAGDGSQRALPVHFRPASTTLCWQGLLLPSLVFCPHPYILGPHPYILGQGQPFVISDFSYCGMLRLLHPRPMEPSMAGEPIDSDTNGSVTFSKSLPGLCL